MLQNYLYLKIDYLHNFNTNDIKIIYRKNTAIFTFHRYKIIYCNIIHYVMFFIVKRNWLGRRYSGLFVREFKVDPRIWPRPTSDRDWQLDNDLIGVSYTTI